MLDRETATTPATRVIDLKGLDPISVMKIGFRMTNSSSVPTGHPVSAIKKIEIVDGSQVIASLSGREALALDFYHNKGSIQNLLTYTTAQTSEAYVGINFGKKLWDPDLAFDPRKFNNPQIKVTHDLSLGGSVPSAAYLSVHLRLFDGKAVSPMGYLMNKEYNSYSLSASAKQTIQMPSDYPLRMMMLHSNGYNKQPFEQFNHVKLSENNDKKVPLDMQTTDLMKIINPMFGRYHESITGTATTGAVPYFVTPTFEQSLLVNSDISNASVYAAELPFGGTALILASIASSFRGQSSGFNPMGALAIPMGNPDDMMDWYDLASLTDLKLLLTAGSAPYAASTCETVLQQLVKY